MSSTLRIRYLRLLQRLGRQSYIARSQFGFPYRISLGDTFSENPFYNPYSNVGEILACASWANQWDRPIIYDIGAHCGFISSQLAFILKERNPVINAFEPVAPTYADLVSSIQSLQLQDLVRSYSIALSSSTGSVKLNYSKWNSMLAHVIDLGHTPSALDGNEFYYAISFPLDYLFSICGVPAVIKIDVEGWEVPVIQGANNALKSDLLAETAWCLEWNPSALKQTGYSGERIYELLSRYRFYYLNDYEGQLIPTLEEIGDIRKIDHVCNLFAIPISSEKSEVWKESFWQLKEAYGVSVSRKG